MHNESTVYTYILGEDYAPRQQIHQNSDQKLNIGKTIGKTKKTKKTKEPRPKLGKTIEKNQKNKKNQSFQGLELEGGPWGVVRSSPWKLCFFWFFWFFQAIPELVVCCNGCQK